MLRLPQLETVHELRFSIEVRGQSLIATKMEHNRIEVINSSISVGKNFPNLKIA